MVTLYHISNSPSWAKSIDEGKSGGKKLDELARPINPDLSKNNRKDDVYGDGRRGDDLGPGFYDTRINAERSKRNHIRQLEALGYKVTLQPAA